VYATSTWYCASLRWLAALALRAADRLDATRQAVRRHEPDDLLAAHRDRILSRYY
jgi:hypothetical protein